MVDCKNYSVNTIGKATGIAKGQLLQNIFLGIRERVKWLDDGNNNTIQLKSSQKQVGAKVKV